MAVELSQFSIRKFLTTWSSVSECKRYREIWGGVVGKGIAESDSGQKDGGGRVSFPRFLPGGEKGKSREWRMARDERRRARREERWS